ncbi:O-antigen translocase [Leclercia adecarboxylata]|uniref:O-antigen translocase n=1 Tax=Leclercia adecarboxylata TaxID=83655 RepID=UPI00254E62FE|nr:O-antigen translocase [Leclercia adecarboxylata]
MRKVLKITVMSGGLTFLKMLMGFIIAKVVAIYTGPAGLATLGQMQSLISALNGIVGAPVSNGIVRYTAENHNISYKDCSPWWRAAVMWVLIISVLLIPLGISFSKYISLWIIHSTSYYWVICLSLILLPITATGILINSVINGHQDYKRFIFLGLISTIFSSILMLLLISLYKIEGALIAAAVQYSFIGLIMILTNLREPWFKFNYWIGRTSKKNLVKTGEYMAMALTTAITTPLSIVIIRNILITNVGWDITGSWQAVWKISEVYLGVITMALTTYYLPQLSKLNNHNEIIHEIKKTAKAIMPVVILLAVFIYLIRDYLVIILFTKEFKQASDLFLFQLVGDVIKILSWMLAFPMISKGATKWYISSEVFFSILLISIAYILIPVYGAHGANYAYVINYIVYLLFVFFNIKKFTK